MYLYHVSIPCIYTMYLYHVSELRSFGTKCGYTVIYVYMLYTCLCTQKNWSLQWNYVLL